MNFVRARAANPAGFVQKGGAPAANYVINQYPAGWAKDNATREKVRFERKLELSGEGHRFYDLVRWSGGYGGTSPTPDYVERVLTGYLTYESPKYPSGAFTGTSFTSKSTDILPLPQAQVDLKPGILTQNPGF